jgi:glycosyltransferase involved in cell wall biosynthesis
MNVGIGFYMGGAQRDGIGWAITHLLQDLLRQAPEHTFTAFTNLDPATVAREFGAPANLRVVGSPATGFTRWEQGWLPRALRRHRIELFHSPLGLPLLSTTPGIATIHDLCFLSCPRTFTRRMRAYFRVFLPLSVRKARLVVTVSDTSRLALTRLLRVPVEKIRVVPNGIGAAFAPVCDPERLARVRARYGLPASFMLYAGTLEPRKNVLALLHACLRLWEDRRVDTPLVLVGKRGWLSEDVHQFLRRPGLAGRVVEAGYVDRFDLPAVYSAARVFVYPSLCEGFGLPPLEAMACGTPVVACNISAMPEILGSAACLVPPGDVTTLAEGIEAVLADETVRRRLRADGLERARRYPWTVAASKMLRVYEEAAAVPA